MTYYDDTTTVPETTVPETTVPETTIPETTTTVAHCPDPDNYYPQNYGKDAPCGPTDPCVGINPDTGLGTTLWTIQPCGTPVETTTTSTATTTTVAATEAPTLPATGASPEVAIVAGVMLLAGVLLTKVARV